MSKLVSNNTYSNILQVDWSENNKYTGVSDFDENFNMITVWKTANNVIASSGYYLGISRQPDGTYITQLFKLTFDGKGATSGNIAVDRLYKLSNSFSFQDSGSYYVKSNNNFVELKVNQGQCTFTSDPANDNNFYIYQKGIEPWTSAPPLPRLVYYYNGTKWYYPLITKTGTLTWNGYIYSYDKSIGDTFGIGLSNTKYVVPNKRVATEW